MTYRVKVTKELYARLYETFQNDYEDDEEREDFGYSFPYFSQWTQRRLGAFWSSSDAAMVFMEIQDAVEFKLKWL